MKWFRFYNEFRSDPKMKRMPIPHRYAFVILLCLASEGDVRGVISGLDDDDIAYELEMSTEDWLTLKSKFKVKNLIDFDKEQVYIINWDKRQFESDSSAARVARHRLKQKQKGCNVTATLVKRHVTPSDTDTDSETEKKEITLVHFESELAQENSDFEHSQNARVSDDSLEQEEATEEPGAEVAVTEEAKAIAEPVQPELFETAKSLGPEKTPPPAAAPPQKASKAPKPNEFTDEAFEQFWSIVPLKKGKEPARSKFKRVVGISLQAFLASYEAAKAQYKATAREPNNWQYFRQPATWINQKGWQDEAIAAFMPKQPATSSDETAQLVAEVTEWAKLMVQAGRAIAYRVDELGKVSIQLSNGKWTSDQSMIRYCSTAKLQYEIQQRERTAA